MAIKFLNAHFIFLHLCPDWDDLPKPVLPKTWFIICWYYKFFLERLLKIWILPSILNGLIDLNNCLKNDLMIISVSLKKSLFSPSLRFSTSLCLASGHDRSIQYILYFSLIFWQSWPPKSPEKHKKFTKIDRTSRFCPWQSWILVVKVSP
jgi:hypothetical protein